MTEPQFDITPFLDQDEGQHFDRKSLFEGARGTKQLRDRRAVRDQVEERPRIEGNLPAVIEETSGVISSLLRRPSRLVGNQFRETSEYPDFAWREALLNAIAHRDYGVEGAGTEVWLFEDRMEVVSPGALAGNLTTDELLTLRRVHRSRNPRIVRVLV
ncbi:MAG: hypothetical protein F4Y91_17650, partial [Gemmatimonadetes bacterium]|nr:hypothetical protein [Gemmatimonadota bacterium]